jgi:YVTN family beta-propeller protein
VAAGTVWVANTGDATVSRVDTATGNVRSPISVGAGPRGVAATRGAVWVADSFELKVTRIDPASGRVVRTVSVGDGPRSVVAGAGALWVIDEYDGTVERIDPTVNAVTRHLQLGSSPRAVAVAGSSVWVATGSPVGTAHRGGTLIVDGDVVPTYETIDPARNWFPATMTMAYDGLVALRRVGGSDGTTLVPDLATALPRPTDGGRTYRFTLRRGIRYSDGGTVLATDLRRGVERALLGPGQEYYLGILGARQCVAHPSDCDLTRGVRTDDERSRVTFHLKSADPDFLAKLTVFAFATPPGVPEREQRKPIPGTGPYMIVDPTRTNQRLRLTMKRNPYFRQWSFAAKPDGYADHVQWRRVRLASARRANLLAGRADVSDPYTSGFSAGVNSALSREHPALLHADPSMGTFYEWLNTRMPPFDDVRVRRALNFAVDRARLVQLLGGGIQVAPTCQVFSANTLGYEKYCPYTAKTPSDGDYHGPDLRTARALVRASGTAGARISVWSDDEPVHLAIGRYYARVLRSLGYRARSTVRSVVEPSVGKSDQMGASWWGVDYPTPTSAWAPLLSCRSAGRADAAATLNHGGFCDPYVEELARRADDPQSTDPARARRLWTQVDRRLTDDAPWVAGPATRFVCLVSPRIGNYQTNPVLGPLIDQMWVR